MLKSAILISIIYVASIYIMKALIKSSLSLVVSIAILTATLPLNQILAQGPNLILNPDIETGDTTPTNWNAGSWGGTEATTTYGVTDGSTGKALGLTITTQGTGDAKWYNDAVAVIAGSTYTLTDSYKTTINSNVVLQYTLNDGTYLYDLVGSLSAAEAWATFTKEFVVPSNATAVSVFHLISTVGTIWTDNYSLSKNDPVIDPDPIDPTPIDPTNLVANPSSENTTVDTTQPLNWLSNAWGTNTSTFEHANTGYSGTHSGHVTTTAWTDGDAKWYHDAVTVTPGKTYTFKDYYKSTITTEIVVQYTTGAGVYQYSFLGIAPAATDWTPIQYNFIAPNGTTSASVFHLIAGVGELWTDNYSITEYQAPILPPAGDNLILNSSVEVADGSAPLNWLSNTWGSNTAAFEYASTGQDGTRSLHVTVSNWVDGDAKWYHTPIAVRDHAKFELSNYYKSTAPSITVIQFTTPAGANTYKILGINPASADWIKSEYEFDVPHGMTSLTIFHVMAQNGELWTDNFNLKEIPVVGETSNVPNGSLEEEISATQPEHWTNGSWGENTAAFEYILLSGNPQNHAVKTTVTDYISGDAKW